MPANRQAFSSAIASSRAHVTDMGRLDVGDDADMGLDLAGQRLDLAGMVHADLEHAVARVARQAGEADRHADMVVVARRAGRGRRLGREHGAQRVLGAGLADRAGDAGDARGAARAAGTAEIDQRLHRVGDAHQSARAPGTSRDDDRGRGAARQRVGDEVVAVGGLARQREEEIALADGAAVEGDAGRLERRRTSRPATARVPPRRKSRARSCAAPCQLARHLGVVERMGDALDGLAGLVALAGDQQQIVGRRRARPCPARSRMRRPSRTSDPVLPVDRDAAHDLGADRRRLLAARIVVGDERAGRRGAWRSRPSPAAWPGRGRRRSRTPRPACPWRTAARSPAPSPAPRACGRSRHRPARRSCGAPRAAAGPARRSTLPAPRRRARHRRRSPRRGRAPPARWRPGSRRPAAARPHARVPSDLDHEMLAARASASSRNRRNSRPLAP